MAVNRPAEKGMAEKAKEFISQATTRISNAVGSYFDHDSKVVRATVGVALVAFSTITLLMASGAIQFQLDQMTAYVVVFGLPTGFLLYKYLDVKFGDKKKKSDTDKWEVLKTVFKILAAAVLATIFFTAINSTVGGAGFIQDPGVTNGMIFAFGLAAGGVGIAQLLLLNAATSKRSVIRSFIGFLLLTAGFVMGAYNFYSMPHPKLLGGSLMTIGGFICVKFAFERLIDIISSKRKKRVDETRALVGARIPNASKA